MKTLISYEDISSSLEEDERYSYTIDSYELDITDVMSKLSDEIKKELENSILTDNEINVGNALVKIIDDWEMLFQEIKGDNKFNKNLILYYIREMTCLNTKDIRNSMKRYKSIYNLIKKDLI